MKFLMKTLSIILLLIYSWNSSKSQDFVVKPMKLYFDCVNGSSQTKNIKVKNFNSDSLTYNINYGNFYRDSLGKTVFIENNYFQYSLLPYIDIQKTFFAINSLDSINIPVTITIPDSIKNSLWSVIYIKSVNEQKTKLNVDEKKSNITISSQIAVKLIYNYPTKELDSILINQIKVSFNDKTKTDNCIVEIYNSGNTIFNGNVNLLFSNIKISNSEKSFTEKVEIMPNSKRIINFDIKEKLSKGSYAFSTITNNYEGKYVAGKQELIVIKE